ncbi:beta-1,3-galactosyl-O-glycosyl-glycoprotein beta-1,6-N-acetylglucosaminyltransferase 4-like [Halichondria panicea]|uniref:beta-1,3-galactosyl-O-glycosyl-glycoprotein beta-1,6-N-acetylglucosaminyltransferase 4-like n=1 Tax=Halichondria panicea TaxID=6063 RepID=UPI00312B2EE4
MAVIVLQKLYTAVVLLGAGFILGWTTVLPGPAPVKTANISESLSKHSQSLLAHHESSTNSSHYKSIDKEERRVSAWLSKLKDTHDLYLSEVCNSHRYAIDSLRPRFLNCTNLFKGSSIEVHKVKFGQKKQKWPIPSDNEFYRYASSCDWIKKELDPGYYVSEQERQFPLAFALNVYQSPYQIFRFLKVIYRRHNLYCIHYDKKSIEPFQKLMVTIADCLPNVIVPSKIADVIWGWHTIVDAQMNCMEDLYKLRYKFPWKYAITLCGKEVPLRTNREMVHTLSKLNGTSAIDVEQNKEYEYDYWTYEHYLKNRIVTQSEQRLAPIPFNLTISKSMAYFGLSKTFVQFLLHSDMVAEFRRFMDHTKIPDEHFIATLFNMTGVPGGKNENYSMLIPTTSSYIWLVDVQQTWQRYCHGNNVHSVCIVSSGDLNRLDYMYDPKKDHQTFFHNKFFIESDRAVMDCAEEELLRRNREECLTDMYN